MMKFFKLSFALLSLAILWGCEEETEPKSENEFQKLDKKIEEIITRYSLPGAQLAIMKEERLVYRASYGLADVESSTPVSNNSLFRIASISKPITAIGIYKLAQDKLLDLDSKVFGEGAILGTTFGTKPYSDEIKSITVRHLLEHKAGGWPNDGSDPMFLPIYYPQDQLIGHILDTKPPSQQPGTTVIYSNFGYCILGRVIEAVSGESYEAYIKKNILEPCGITSMQVGRKFMSEKHENEVNYYNPASEFSPYEIDVKRMDAGGGWIAKATDLLRFMARIDRLGQKEDLLNEYYLTQMYFGFTNWFHTGGMAGTSAILERADDNFSFSILANGNAINFDATIVELRKAVFDEINSRPTWPDHDLFDSQ
ncbi:beta-lactamase family protein [Algoriphagus aestuariicola]|jgi:CubicO group peptidase (beta-lactamase class C family)|uniref:Beta-lactamase family protein n=1 Tax=Algoriphagus aestuariicola TaxID=1852016 RepID=A0ABS3BKC1_9BACT|nr:serine hydrolase domain-containing protein [Algoriphagus aestuariicola]MBN7799490.1 beta-lactamase family protein [Algoriphagus aestuariicola]